MKRTMKKARYAGFGIRFLAYLIDFFLLLIPGMVIAMLAVIMTGHTYMSYVFSFAFIVLYVYLEGVKGGTPGKLLLGLRIVNPKGTYIGIPNAVLRYIGRSISTMILGIGFFMIIWDKKKQGLHDKIAATYVIRI